MEQVLSEASKRVDQVISDARKDVNKPIEADAEDIKVSNKKELRETSIDLAFS